MPKTRKTWFIRSGRYAQGPISSAELAQMARAGVLKPDAEISHDEDGPWRPARQVRGLVFPAPELPPLLPPEPFDSFADPVSPAQPQDAGILLEVDTPPEIPGPEPAPEPEPEPAVSFEAAPPPVPLPGTVPPPTRERHPAYLILMVAYGIGLGLGVLSLLAGLLFLGVGLVTASGARSVDDHVRARAFLASGGAGLAAGLLLVVAAEALSALRDLVRDARRQRIAAERTAALLDDLLSRQP